MNKMRAIVIGILVCSLSVHAVGEELQIAQESFAYFSNYLNQYSFCTKLQEQDSGNTLSFDAIVKLGNAKKELGDALESESNMLDYHSHLKLFYEDFISVLEAFSESIYGQEPLQNRGKRTRLEDDKKPVQSNAQKADDLLRQINESLSVMSAIVGDSMNFNLVWHKLHRNFNYEENIFSN